MAAACAELSQEAHYVTTAHGGAGAVREVIEMILKGTGRWESAIAKYLTVLLAGLLLGLLTYKPHFGLLFPIALLCGEADYTLFDCI